MIALSAVVIIGAIAAVTYSLTSRDTGKSSPAVTGTTAASTTATTGPPATQPAATTPSTVLGPSGNPASWPAAQPTAPSLSSLYNTPPDLIAIVKTLKSYEDWVYTHPDPTLIANYIQAGTTTYDNTVKDVTYLKSNGWHAPPDPTEIDFVKVTEQPQPSPPFNGKPRTIFGHPAYSSGLVDVVINMTGGPLLDATGKVVKTYPATGQVAYSWSLAQSPTDGRWRLVDEQRLNPPGGIGALETP